MAETGLLISTIQPFLPEPTATFEAAPGVPTPFQAGSRAGQLGNQNDANYRAILIANAASTGACVCVCIAYWLLRRKHPRLMTRTTLKLSLAMAVTDLVYHTANLAGYGDLPRGPICAFVGGWLFAAPSLLSLFYACAIALNTQLIFVHERPFAMAQQKWFLIVPPLIALAITIPTLASGVYGFDEAFQYCWYRTEGLSNMKLVLNTVLTFDLWCFLSVAYLFVAATMIIHKVYSKKSRLDQIAPQGSKVETGMQSSSSKLSLEKKTYALNGESTTSKTTSLSETLKRRDAARRALVLRLLGYIFVPVICILSGVIFDLASKTRFTPSEAASLFKEAGDDSTLNAIVDALAGMMGTFNAILFGVDPSVLAVLYAVRIEKEDERRSAALKAQGLQGASAVGQSIVIRVDVEKSDDREIDYVDEVEEFYQGL